MSVSDTRRKIWSQIVPGPKEQVEALAAPTSDGERPTAQRRHRLAWAVLLARVFQFDVTECPTCGGRMKIVAAVADARSIRKYLEGVGLPSRAPPIAPAGWGPLRWKSKLIYSMAKHRESPFEKRF